MPLDLENKLLFIHIPKTGGSSIEQALGMAKFEGPDDQLTAVKKGSLIMTKSKTLSLVTKNTQHFTYRELCLETGHDYKDFRIFTVVRNPLDRIVSEFKYLKKIHGVRAPQDFSSFLSYVKDNISNVNSLDGHLTPMVEYIKGCEDRVKILRLENIDEDWKSISDVLLPKVNVSEKQKVALSKEDEVLVRDLYKEDYSKFNYE